MQYVHSVCSNTLKQLDTMLDGSTTNIQLKYNL